MKLSQLLEALKPSQYRDLVKGWDKSKYADLFGGKYRIYIPLGEKAKDVKVNPEVESFVKSVGYEIEDYLTGIASKDNGKRKVRIGKLLAKEAELKKLFDNDPSRNSSQSEYIVVISRHPYDIAGMTSGRAWEDESCMNLDSGVNRQYVPLDIKEGTLVAYLIKNTDKNIESPSARVLIKPFINLDGSGEIAFGVEEKVYGKPNTEFQKTVVDWADSINKKKGLSGFFQLNKKLYNDVRWDGPRINAVGISDKEIKDMYSVDRYTFSRKINEWTEKQILLYIRYEPSGYSSILLKRKDNSKEFISKVVTLMSLYHPEDLLESYEIEEGYDNGLNINDLPESVIDTILNKSTYVYTKRLIAYGYKFSKEFAKKIIIDYKTAKIFPLLNDVLNFTEADYFEMLNGNGNILSDIVDAGALDLSNKKTLLKVVSNKNINVYTLDKILDAHKDLIDELPDDIYLEYLHFSWLGGRKRTKFSEQLAQKVLARDTNNLDLLLKRGVTITKGIIEAGVGDQHKIQIINLRNIINVLTSTENYTFTKPVLQSLIDISFDIRKFSQLKRICRHFASEGLPFDMDAYILDKVEKNKDLNPLEINEVLGGMDELPMVSKTFDRYEKLKEENDKQLK